jgi:hypothetical protein
MGGVERTRSLGNNGISHHRARGLERDCRQAGLGEMSANGDRDQSASMLLEQSLVVNAEVMSLDESARRPAETRPDGGLPSLWWTRYLDTMLQTILTSESQRWMWTVGAQRVARQCVFDGRRNPWPISE